MNSNEELQERWKSCVFTVCRAMPFVDKAIQSVKDLAERLIEVIRDLVTKVKHIFSNLNEMLSKYGFNKDVYQCSTIVGYKDNEKQPTYPHGYPPYVHNLKLNKRGYPRPVFRCARSRCL